MIHKSFSAAETKVLGDADQGLVECVFSATGNVDRQGDRIIPGAFAKALSGKASVPVVYSHAWQDISQVLGRTTSWREMLPGDPGLPESLRSKGYGGVKATIQFEMGVQSGREAFTHLKSGNLTDYSFAFDIDDGGEKFEGNVREIKSIKEIFEVTVALIGANQLTSTVVAKQVDDDVEWKSVMKYVAEQASREEQAAQPVARPADSGGYTVSLRLGDPGYIEHLHAMKRAEWEAEQRYYEELRRKMGLPANHGR